MVISEPQSPAHVSMEFEIECILIESDLQSLLAFSWSEETIGAGRLWILCDHIDHKASSTTMRNNEARRDHNTF